MLNPFTHRGSLYWDEISRIIRDNVTPSSILRIYPPTLYQPTIVTICDFSRRRIREVLYDPAMESHHIAELECARVANGSWLRGECPLDGWRGGLVTNESTGTTLLRGEVRGVRALVRMLLQEGVLRPTRELDMLLKGDSRECAPRERWYT